MMIIFLMGVWLVPASAFTVPRPYVLPGRSTSYRPPGPIFEQSPDMGPDTIHTSSDSVDRSELETEAVPTKDEATFVPTPLQVDDGALTEALSVVLEASQEAVAKAEEVLQQVDRSSPNGPILVTGVSSTTANSSTSTEASQEDDDDDMRVAVSAILAASEVAIAEAEASLSPSTASPLSGNQELVPEIPAPSTAKILQFAIPAIGVWMCSPLLSLIDTSTVGLLSGTTQQAALNPAVAVTDYAALLIAFLYTGTTNLVAAARETDHGVEGAPRTARTFVGALQLSTFVGLGLGTILFVFARPLLRAIIGNDAISPAVFDAAMKYVRIRALGMPAAALIGSAQAACLGMQDIRSPLYVLLAAAVVNFLGDLLFVGNTNAWIGGAAGAAWATVFSQVAAVALFVHWLCHKPRGSPRVMNLSAAILELTGASHDGEGRRQRFLNALYPSSTSITPGGDGVNSRLEAKESKSVHDKIKPKGSKSDTFSVRGFLQGRFRGRDLIKLPGRNTVEEFAPYVLPVTSTQVGRVSGYVAMSHVVSSSLGTISMAAQQVIVSLFYCLTPIADSLSLTAQSFVPAISEKKKSKARAQALRKIALNFGKAGIVFSAVMVASVSFVPLVSRFFTSDPSVSAMVNTVIPLLMGFFSVHGPCLAAEGMILGQKDLNFLGKMYAAYFAVVPYFMLRVKRAALSGTSVVDLTHIWKVFLGYQLFRAFAWVSRVALLQVRTEREAEAGPRVPTA